MYASLPSFKSAPRRIGFASSPCVTAVILIIFGSRFAVFTRLWQPLISWWHICASCTRRYNSANGTHFHHHHMWFGSAAFYYGVDVSVKQQLTQSTYPHTSPPLQVFLACEFATSLEIIVHREKKERIGYCFHLIVWQCLISDGSKPISTWNFHT